jgi:hypothetical protein
MRTKGFSYKAYLRIGAVVAFIIIIAITLWKANFMHPEENFEVKDADAHPEIIVTMTTNPTRIKNLQPLLATLSNQTVPPTAIVMNIPHVFKRTNESYEIPEFITSNPLVRVNRCEDIGPATKIIPTVALFADPETILISVDDDIEYRNNLVETLLKYSNMDPDAAVTGESYMFTEEVDGKKYGELVEGYSSVLYKKKFFDHFDQETLKNYPKFCYFADDFILSNYLRKHHIRILIVDEPDENKPAAKIFLDYGNGDDALRNGANGQTKGNIDNYQKCSNYLKENNDLHINYYK